MPFSILAVDCSEAAYLSFSISIREGTRIDIRPEVIEQAKKQIRKHKPTDKMPTVIVSGGFGQGKLDDRSYDYIWCFQVFHVLEDDLVDACLRQVSRVLAQNGLFYADINATCEERRWKEFPYVRRPLRFYENLAQRHGFRMKELGQVRDSGYTPNTAQSGQYNQLLEFQRNSR